MEKSYSVGDIVMMKKPHPCGNNNWKVLRLGADIRIQCTKCGRMVLMSRRDFEKYLRKNLSSVENTDKQ